MASEALMERQRDPGTTSSSIDDVLNYIRAGMRQGRLVPGQRLVAIHDSFDRVSGDYLSYNEQFHNTIIELRGKCQLDAGYRHDPEEGCRRGRAQDNSPHRGVLSADSRRSGPLFHVMGGRLAALQAASL